MILCDSHLHSKYSFDSETELDVLCEEYIAKGFNRIALTDHYDIDGIQDGLYAPYMISDAKADFARAAEKYADKLEMVFGIELGQAPFRWEDSIHFLHNGGFDFVIGSIHNLDLFPDFYYLNFAHMPDEMIRRLYSLYLDALFELVRFGRIDTLAHVTYPMRYIHARGRNLDISEYYDRYRELFHILIESGIALEVNTGKVRANYVLSPDKDLISLYADCGGKRVTVGSDSHRVGEYGADVENAIEVIRSCGFTELVLPSQNGTETVKL